MLKIDVSASQPEINGFTIRAKLLILIHRTIRNTNKYKIIKHSQYLSNLDGLIKASVFRHDLSSSREVTKINKQTLLEIMSGASARISGRQSLATIIIIIFPGQNLRVLASPQRTNNGSRSYFRR